MELPVSNDLASEIDFILCKYVLCFHFDFLDLDLDFEVRFLGTAMKLNSLFYIIRLLVMNIINIISASSDNITACEQIIVLLY